MTTKEVSELTGIAISTVTLYARKWNITYYGEGMRKVYDWKKADIEKLKKITAGRVGKRGRPKSNKKH